MTAVVSHREHGTHAKYVIDRCRCDACRIANRDYERARAQRVEPAYVSAERAREHVNYLRVNGVGLKTVAKRSGVSHGALAKLMYGDRQRGMGPSKRIRCDTEQKILAVTVHDAADGAYIPAGPTWTIVDQLLERGWTRAEIGRRINGPQAQSLQLGRDLLTRRNASIVAALLDEPVPPRRSRHGLHPVPQPDPTEALRDEARREQERLRRAAYRHPDEPVHVGPNLFELDPIPSGTDPVVEGTGGVRAPGRAELVVLPGPGRHGDPPTRQGGLRPLPGACGVPRLRAADG